MRQNRSKRLISARASEKNVKQKAFSFWGPLPPDSLTRGSASGPRWGQARSYVQARRGSCLLVPHRLNFFETQINVMRNCVKRKKIWQKESYKLVAVAVRLRSTPML